MISRGEIFSLRGRCCSFPFSTFQGESGHLVEWLEARGFDSVTLRKLIRACNTMGVTSAAELGRLGSLYGKSQDDFKAVREALVGAGLTGLNAAAMAGVADCFDDALILAKLNKSKRKNLSFSKFLPDFENRETPADAVCEAILLALEKGRLAVPELSEVVSRHDAESGLTSKPIKCELDAALRVKMFFRAFQACAQAPSCSSALGLEHVKHFQMLLDFVPLKFASIVGNELRVRSAIAVSFTQFFATMDSPIRALQSAVSEVYELRAKNIWDSMNYEQPAATPGFGIPALAKGGDGTKGKGKGKSKGGVGKGGGQLAGILAPPTPVFCPIAVNTPAVTAATQKPKSSGTRQYSVGHGKSFRRICFAYNSVAGCTLGKECKMLHVCPVKNCSSWQSCVLTNHPDELRDQEQYEKANPRRTSTTPAWSQWYLISFSPYKCLITIFCFFVQFGL